MFEMASNEEKQKQVEGMLKNSDSETLQRIIMNTACLECRKCSGFLTPPIASVDQVGNVCGNCSETYQEETLNVELNTIMSDCIVPCLYTNNGCTEEMPFFSLGSHQRFCEHQYYLCPLNCNELQHAGSLLTHVQLKHSQNLLILKPNMLPMMIKIRFNHIYNHALMFNSSLFFIKIEYNDQRTHLHCAMFYVGNENKDFIYQITQVGSLVVPYELERNVLRNLSLWNDPITNHCLSIACDFIKTPSSESTEIHVRVDEKIKKLGVSNLMLKQLECPICFQFFRPPIYQCTTGHSICSQCRSTLTKCPTCENEFGNTRNYSLEALSASLNLVNVQA